MALIWTRTVDDDWKGYPPGSDLAVARPYVTVEQENYRNATLWKVWYVSIVETDTDVFLDDLIGAKTSAEVHYENSLPKVPSMDSEDLPDWDDLEAAFQSVREFCHKSYAVAWTLGYDKRRNEA